jgi:hypothetical protein
MKAVDFEDTVRRRADRLRGSASHLIDDGQSAANAKLNEAAVIIQGAFAHLLEESQELIRAKMAEASYVLQQSRERAAQGVRHAVDHARDQAEDSYGEWRKMARTRPLAMAAVAIALGVAAGLALRRRKSVGDLTGKNGPDAKPERIRPPVKAKTPAPATRRTPSARKTASGRKPPPSEPPAVPH